MEGGQQLSTGRVYAQSKVAVFEILVSFVQHHDWKKAFHQVIPHRKQAKDSSHAPSPSIPIAESLLSPSSDSAATTCKNTDIPVTAADGGIPAPPQSNLATSSNVEEHSPSYFSSGC